MTINFTATEVRDIIPDIMVAVLDPMHVLSRPLKEISPIGYDVQSFGRVGSSKARRYYGGNQLVNTTDGTYRVSRNLKAGQRRVSVNLIREYKYTGVNGKYANVFYDEYRIVIQVADFELAHPLVNEQFYTFNFGTRKVKWDKSKSFRDFVLTDLVEEYNNFGAQLMDDWNKKKDEMRKILVGLDKYK